MIDDGPPDLEEALAMARAAVESGIATLAATPHLHPRFPGVRVAQLAGRCGHLLGELEHARIPLAIVPGAEVSVSWALQASDEELALASYDHRGTDLLIETPFDQLVGFERFVGQLHEQGYRITLAHPERCAEFQRDPAPLCALVEQAVLLQVNAESLLGSGIGHAAKRLARELVRDGVAHVIASDGHRARSWRPVTRLAEAVQAATELVGPDRAQWMAEAAPRAITEGAELPDPPPVASQRRRGLLGWPHSKPLRTA